MATPTTDTFEKAFEYHLGTAVLLFIISYLPTLLILAQARLLKADPCWPHKSPDTLSGCPAVLSVKYKNKFPHL